MTLQQASERRPKKVDLNLLPSEYRPVKKSRLGIILYLIVFVLICAMVPLIIMKLGVDSDTKSLKDNLANLQQQINTLQANKNEADPIKDQIAVVQGQLVSMEADYQSFIDNRSAWSEIINEVFDLVPGNKLSLSSVAISSSNIITISGTSTKRIYVYDYAVNLEESDFFTGVDFTFGDCPETDKCTFSITVPLTTLNQTEGGS